MSSCPDDNDMVCYFEGLLSEDEVEQLEEHFVGCERCREVVAITKQIMSQDMSQEPNFLDNNHGSGNIKMKISCVPSLKGEVPDVKKVKPSL